jgi:uncharacterized protein RhaS with RHS repeats
MTYDAAGNVVADTVANDNTISFSDDGLSRQLTGTKPLGQTLTYVHDSRDRLDYRFNARWHKIDYGHPLWGPVIHEHILSHATRALANCSARASSECAQCFRD